MNENYLSLSEKWMIDVEAYRQSGGMLIRDPQCRMCKYWIKNDAWHCKQYPKEKKPSFVLDAEKECTKFNSIEDIRISATSVFECKMKGGIWGAIVGDALGVPMEFSERHTRKKDPVGEMRAYGTYHQPFGTWSDDSSMMLCLIESIVEGLSCDGLADKFIQFEENAYMTPYNVVFDIGNTVARAIDKMKAGFPAVECGGSAEYDNGNGSLMRVLPLAFYLREQEAKQQVKVIEDVSAITHRHPISKFSCLFYIKMAMCLLVDYDKKSAYRATVDYVKKELSNSYSDIFPQFDRLLHGKIQNATMRSIRSSGFVIDTLEAAIWCFIKTDSYRECIFKAINLGGDTDTIACIAGGLAGIYYGVHNIPNNWIQMLAKKNELNNLIDRFYEAVQ